MKFLMLTLLLCLTVWLQVSHSVIVPCPDQDEYCECPDTATECEFTFRVEHRFSFTSYPLTSPGKQLTEIGYLYFLDATGYHPTSQEETDECFHNGLQNDEDFLSRNCSIPMTLDGVTYRPLLLINGRVPGPTLVVTESQIVIVHVINRIMGADITIHWHGMFQKRSVWMDGVGYVTQPPIDGAGASFDYIFKAEPSGTHWYHSHVSSQKGNGMFGALVVREKRPLAYFLENSRFERVIDNAGQHTLTFSDWERKFEAVEQALTELPFYPQLPIGQIPTDQDEADTPVRSVDGVGLGSFPFWSGLINGRGRFSSTTLAPLSTFAVEEGNMYHFRLTGTMSIFAFRVSIDGHKLKAIASDGYYFEPMEVDYIVIHVGETYDFILETNQPVGNYWIRAETLENLPPGEEHSARAILTYNNPEVLNWTNGYSNVPEVTRECTQSNRCKVLNCPFKNYPTSSNLSCIPLTDLVAKRESLFQFGDMPAFPPNTTSCPSCEHFVDFAAQGPGGARSINARTFEVPPTPYATNCYAYDKQKNDSVTNTCNKCDIDANSTTGGCRCIHVLPIASEIAYDSDNHPSVALVFSGVNSGFSHPIHLHGHSYHIVHIGYGEYNETTGEKISRNTDIDCGTGRLCVDPKWRDNTIPPEVLNRTVNGSVISTAIRKDTVILPSGGYVVVAFNADNPGFWFMHCHVEQHLVEGMVLAVQEYSSKHHWAPPPGINQHGSFKWTIENYNKTINSGTTCADSEPMEPETEKASTECIISSDGFASLVAVLAVVIIVLTIVNVVLIIVCCCRSIDKPTKEDIPMEKRS